MTLALVQRFGIRATRVSAAVSITAVFFCGATEPAVAQSADQVGVVINDRSAASQKIGEYYASRRGIPPANIFHIQAPLAEQIDQATFNNSIELPVRTLIGRRGLHDRVLYLVLAMDIPLWISGTVGELGTSATVESELALLYRRMVGTHVPVPGVVPNPYYAADGDPTAMRPFTRRNHDIFLVSRLDGPSVEAVIALIDRGVSPATGGVVALSSGSRPREWIEAAASRIAATRQDGVSVATDTWPHAEIPLLGYYGSPVGAGIHAPFAAGSIAAFEAYMPFTFRRTTAPGSAAYSAVQPSSPRPLGSLLEDGVTGLVADTGSPITSIRPDILFPAYLAGASIVDAAYLSIASLSANTIVIGDPLCAPFRHGLPDHRDEDVTDDPVTRLPGIFSQRRVDELAANIPFIPRSAIALTLGADWQMQAGDQPAARALLEQAVAIAPSFAIAQFNLGVLDQAEARYDKAIERFRLALDGDPPHGRDIRWVVFGQSGVLRVRQAAFNNLAYMLAVYRHAPEEALPLARSAVALSPDNPSLLDTLAWVEYLLGNNADAVRHIREALSLAPPTVGIALHAATIFAVSGAAKDAQTLLDEVLRVYPDQAASEDVTRVRSLLHDSQADQAGAEATRVPQP